MDETKICIGCHRAQPLTEFRRPSPGKRSHHSRCRTCENAEHRVRYAAKRCGQRPPTRRADPAVMALALAGARPKMNWAERRLAVITLVRGRGWYDRPTALYLGLSERTVLRIRQSLQIPSPYRLQLTGTRSRARATREERDAA